VDDARDAAPPPRCLRVVQVVEMAEKKKDRKAARETESMVFEYRLV